MQQFQYMRHHSWKTFGSNQFDNSWDITLCKICHCPIFSRSAEILLFVKYDIVLHFQGQLMWRFCCQTQLNKFGESWVEVGIYKSRDIMIFVNGDLEQLFQGQLWYDILLPAKLSSLLWRFGKNHSYTSCDTAIFVNSDLDLNFQDQMIRYFCCWPWFDHSEWLQHGDGNIQCF